MNRTNADTRFMEELEPRKLLSGDAGSLSFEAFYPEGFAHDGISEFVPITNPNDVQIEYELHARYAKGDRDQLIQRGVIPAQTRRGVVINRAGQPQTLRVRPNEPYALVLKASAPVGATISHYDFGTAIGETFTQKTSTEWTFGEGRRGATTRDFVVVYNPSDQDAAITLTVFTETGQTKTLTRVVGAQRRGGWNLATSTTLPQGEFGVRVTSTVPIVAAISAYQIDTEQGFGAIGEADGGATAGVINGIKIRDESRRGGSSGDSSKDDGSTDDNPSGDDGSTDDSTSSPNRANAFIKILNTNPAAARVTFTFIPKKESLDPSLVPPPQTIDVPAGSHSQISILDLAPPLDEDFTLVYRSDAPVTVTASRFEAADAVGVEAASIAATQWTFGEGFMSQNRAGAAVTEDVYLFNPTNKTFNVTIEFFFNNGTRVGLTKSLSSLEVEDVEVHDLLEITSIASQVFYGIRITSPTPIVSTMEHWDRDLGGGFATLGLPGGTIVDVADVLVL